MIALALIGILLLVCVGAAISAVLLAAGDNDEPFALDVFAMLPVPDSAPATRAFLEYYASQIMWMDADVLRCVILVANEESLPLCQELARDHACYTAMTLPQARAFLDGKFE